MLRKYRLSALVFILLLTGVHFSKAQNPGNLAIAADSNKQAIKVFLNCGTWCYNNYLKTQTTWAYFVQDQFVADVNLRINSLSTGSGGGQYNLIFEGQGKISHLRDTVSFTTTGINTDNEVREILLKHVQLGLVRYAMQTETHDVLKISSTDTTDNQEIGQGSNPEDDPFNAWIYNLSIYGNGDGQKSSISTSLGGWIAATQVKETHKIKLSVRYNSRVNQYDYQGVKSKYQVDNYRASGYFVKSLNQHWSAGTFNSWSRSSFDNFKNAVENSMALEYNLFPYKSSQTKQLTASIYAGSQYYDYADTTIYLKKREWRPLGNFNIQGSFNPSWGSASLGMSTSILLDDLRKNSTSIYASMSARIFKGLSISLDGNFSFIRNQINLPKEGASIDQVLLSQQVIATNYSYYFYASVSYRFGSIFNNVVNTRFSNEY